MSSFSLTSDVVNYLIYRYLQEAGFTHSAFTFASESLVTRTNIDPNNVPPGSLVTFIQKGLQYLEIEANLDAQVRGEGCRHVTAAQAAAAQAATAQAATAQAATAQAAAGQAAAAAAPAAAAAQAAGPSSQPQPAPPSGDARATAPSTAPAAATAQQQPSVKLDAPASIEVPASAVITLNGHDSEVYICAWSPVEPLLASGSGDATARIWNLATTAGTAHTRSVVLNHEAKQDKSQGKDVTTLDWNADGSLLATGSYDGLARIWSKDGKLKQTLDKHQGPIFALKWNKRGDLLLSGSVDKTAIVWDAKSGEAKQVFDLHSAPTLDVDWRNSNSFATCSTDRLIHVCKLGETKAMRTYAGHDDEVNAIKWDPSGRLLASCSDDKTAKVWSLNSDRPVQDFRDHEREIYTIRWSPTGSGSANPNMPLLLASASFDTTVRLWDIEAGRCVQCLHRHVEPVYSVAFSPNGKLVATGSFDKCVYVWSVEEGVLVRSFRGDAGIYEVCWNKEGTRVAACFANRTICVMDISV
ncbi:hypothetical protein VOLCADRAFT_63837 [Volvox carteri f. nagariensis]|uniref:Uncharacterized protein n=1 Tax=Volvox carteri f. nagariensis TaxID=3068 RepID=D8U4D4_VOLCA|nr:uncharacterized protein VOLCADRAFT_63837 [Volvox carteri f. nagariensis]EFJ45385.1 hypothetical protein VOLCADRAFT_63837 [Volvox carteri f. nagariensis]|eukprot:XP_002953412.1 hypothetical protein VOLCADRAFT_63837 [Volvox carteri f. nagariensis]